MRLRRIRSGKYYLFLVMLFAVTTMGSAIAYADSGTAIVSVKAGELTAANVKNQVNLPLTHKKSTQIVSYSLPITVIDARGSGAGWKLMITSMIFRLKDHDHDTRKDLLPTNASSVVGLSTSCGANSTCTSPTNGVSYPLIIPAGKAPPPPVKFFDAATRSGLGVLSLVMAVNVTVPANMEGGTYTSTVYITIASGP